MIILSEASGIFSKLRLRHRRKTCNLEILQSHNHHKTIQVIIKFHANTATSMFKMALAIESDLYLACIN